MITVLLALFSVSNSDNPCYQATDCGTCIQTNAKCHWCADTDYTTGKFFRRSRCSSSNEELQKEKCKNIISVTSSLKMVHNESFSDTVQVSPQNITLSLRNGDPIEFTLSVKPAKDFPVDIYYLMDVSASMEDDLSNLQQLGKKIAKEIQKITKDYRFAFGSFVDKNVPPFIQPQDPTFPCNNMRGDKSHCRATFGYIHFFDFSRDVSQFEAVVANQKISGDSDSPEGGFDGLMQVTVCDKELGWRPKGKARKIVIFVTDAYPKIAGDGKLGGIFVPNDGRCHLSKRKGVDGVETYYSLSSDQDYPSIHFLKKKMGENEIVPIIAVTKEVMPIYKEIAAAWKNLGAEVDILSSDSSNIVQLIKNNYKKISTTVRLLDDRPSSIKIDYKVDKKTCPNGRPSDKPNECSNTLLDQKVDFKIKVHATTCPKVPTTSFKIRISGFGEVFVRINHLCTCSCETAGRPYSPHCNSSGTLECGVCKCDPGRLGSNCQCNATSTEATVIGRCRRNNGSEICSGSGNCVCGKCECFKASEPRHRIYGQYCQCKNFACDKYNGKECGGRRGKCECGECHCKKEFIGSNCGERNCNITTRKHCTMNKMVCSNNGRCDCQLGSCVCDSGYAGKYCEECFTKSCQCSSFKDCVLCWNENEDNQGACAQSCRGTDVILTNATDQSCSAITPRKCLLYYSVNDTIGVNGTLFIQNHQDCPLFAEDDDDSILVIIFSTIGGIVLLGLLLLLSWKLLITMHDRREYESFKNSQGTSTWKEEDNPVYRPPTQVYDNPSFISGRK